MHNKKQIGHSKRFRYSDRHFKDVTYMYGSYISYENSLSLVPMLHMRTVVRERNTLTL